MHLYGVGRRELNLNRFYWHSQGYCHEPCYGCNFELPFPNTSVAFLTLQVACLSLEQFCTKQSLLFFKRIVLCNRMVLPNYNFPVLIISIKTISLAQELNNLVGIVISIPW